MAGVDVFVTGGIGGVHRDAQNTMDVSADLTELARTPVAVVCAGVKSILDIGRTLEYLETMGVPVTVSVKCIHTHIHTCTCIVYWLSQISFRHLTDILILWLGHGQ